MLIEERAAKFLERRGVRLAVAGGNRLVFLMPPKPNLLRLLIGLRRLLARKRTEIDPAAMIS